jgi:hypothetical protein
MKKTQDTCISSFIIIFISIKTVSNYDNKLSFLKDVLENDDIQLDSMFVASIVFDIIRVS